jgi:hypothetical protein
MSHITAWLHTGRWFTTALSVVAVVVIVNLMVKFPTPTFERSLTHAEQVPLEQLADEQFVSLVHGAHMPFVQTPFTQSDAAPQTWLFAHFGAQAGGAHLLLVQTPEAQSVGWLQSLPSGQLGAQAGVVAASFPASATEPASLPVPASPPAAASLPVPASPPDAASAPVPPSPPDPPSPPEDPLSVFPASPPELPASPPELLPPPWVAESWVRPESIGSSPLLVPPLEPSAPVVPSGPPSSKLSLWVLLAPPHAAMTLAAKSPARTTAERRFMDTDPFE